MRPNNCADAVAPNAEDRALNVDIVLANGGTSNGACTGKLLMIDYTDRGDTRDIALVLKGGRTPSWRQCAARKKVHSQSGASIHYAPALPAGKLTQPSITLRGIRSRNQRCRGCAPAAFVCGQPLRPMHLGDVPSFVVVRSGSGRSPAHSPASLLTLVVEYPRMLPKWFELLFC